MVFAAIELLHYIEFWLHNLCVTEAPRKGKEKKATTEESVCVCVFYEALSKVLSERRKGALFRRTTTPEEFTECVMMTYVLRLVVFQICTLKKTH